ncbi:unnamed protein product [Clonostachys chloroleuca]|uniref:Uncharacterized protein n=1 Tax=Clonostachys chloroleuca TaxID=1926264 RepID=A0AA35M4R6_9HYPO|nr:unnamed protein product [Clonostachys chloroleuca]
MTQWDELHTQLHVPADGRKVWVSGEDLLYKPLAHSLRLETSPHPQQLGIPAARHCALALAGHPSTPESRNMHLEPVADHGLCGQGQAFPARETFAATGFGTGPST